jgi:hypothetical protein
MAKVLKQKVNCVAANIYWFFDKSYAFYNMPVIFTKSNNQHMIQRIQSVWLFLAGLSILALFLFPYLQLMNADGTGKAVMITGMHENINGQAVQTESFTTLTIATVIVALVPWATIFFFRDRKRQIAMCYLAIILILGYSFWLVQVAKQAAGNVTLGIQNYGLGIVMPSLAIFFIILALRGIRRDEKLVRSADRLR